jgi:hypothetical protein
VLERSSSVPTGGRIEIASTEYEREREEEREREREREREGGRERDASKRANLDEVEIVQAGK